MNSSDDEGGEPKEKKIKSKSAAKKIVKNPQAKLDDMRLCGQRGLPLLPKTFRDVKFKGKGVAIIWEQGIFGGIITLVYCRVKQQDLQLYLLSART